MLESLDRRTFLEIVGAATVALAGCTGGDGPTETGSPTDTATPTGTSDGDDGETGGERSPTGSAESAIEPGAEIELGARVDGWVGRAPSSIEGTTNPTLGLEAGADYAVTWENLDGEEHELYVETDDGSVVAESDSSEQTGETVTVTVAATEEMASYFCEYHPDSMRGDVSVGGSGGTGSGTEGETGTETGDGTETGEGTGTETGEQTGTETGGTTATGDGDY